MTQQEYTEALVQYKRDLGTYNPAQTPAIMVAAAQMVTVEMATREIAALDKTTVEGSHGGIQPHPAFKTQKDAIETLLRALKALGLTADDMPTGTDDDRLTLLGQDIHDLLKQSIS